MPCERCAEEEVTTYLSWMRKNIEYALRSGTLNSVLGLLAAAYCEAMGKILRPKEKQNAHRFHAFVSTRLADELRPHPPASEEMDRLLEPMRKRSAFKDDPHPGFFAFWEYRNGFSHSFALLTGHEVELRWGRYEQKRVWVRRPPEPEPAACSVCQRRPVIDLNVRYVGEAFIRACALQEQLWRDEVAARATTWRNLLERLARRG